MGGGGVGVVVGGGVVVVVVVGVVVLGLLHPLLLSPSTACNPCPGKAAWRRRPNDDCMISRGTTRRSSRPNSLGSAPPPDK
jgi:hypothetical protein